MQRDELGLVLRLRNRDPRAMAELYDQYSRAVYAAIHRQVRDCCVVEDLVQETFLRVWTHVHGFDADRGSLGTWVLAVARNRAIDYLRSVDFRLARSSVELSSAAPAPAARLEDELLHRQRTGAIRRAIRGLSANHRLVLELAFGQGLSHGEIAGRLRQPLGTVKTWVRTALRELRAQVAC